MLMNYSNRKLLRLAMLTYKIFLLAYPYYLMELITLLTSVLLLNLIMKQWEPTC